MKGCWCARVLVLQRRALLLEWLAARVRGCEGAKALVGWALFVDLIEVEERGLPWPKPWRTSRILES